MANGVRREYSDIANEMLGKMAGEQPEVGPDNTVKAIVAVGYALMAINVTLNRLGNEVSSAKTMIQGLRR